MSKASKAEKKAQKAAKKNAATINDQYDESSRLLTDEEAHRNVSYELPSFTSQMMECFKVQMKRYTRQKVMWLCIILLALIPVVVLAIRALSPGMLSDTDVANIYMADILSLGSVIIPFIASVSCGSMLSQELNERTVFLSLPLPMSRLAFFLGKFFAGLILIEGTVAAAYGLSIVMSLSATTKIYTTSIFVSFVIAACYALFCCSLSYAMSTKSRRGSSMLPFIILFVVMPLVCILLMAYVNIGFLTTICQYMPCFANDQAINVIGSSATISVGWIMKTLFVSQFAISYGDSAVVIIAVSILLSIAMLGLSYRSIKRRDM